jgi:hypothetical protein
VNSGVTSSDTWLQLGHNNGGQTVVNQSGLSEITSGVLLAIINADQAFNATENNFPILKDFGVITTTGQRPIPIFWIE